MSELPKTVSAGERSAWGAPIAWLAVMVVVAGIASAPGLLITPNHWDSCLFVWQGKRLLAGDLPYVSVWDQKLPVLLWINAWAAASGHVYAALYVIQSVAIGVGAWLIGLMSRRNLGPAAGVASGLAYVTLASTTAMLGTGNLTEIYAAPFGILCLYAMIRLAEGSRLLWLWPVIGGLALGAATMLRPPAVLIAAALFPLVPAIRRARLSLWKIAAVWIGGYAMIPLTTVIWAASKGILGPMIRDCILHNVAYAAGTGVPESANWRHVGRSLQNMAISTWVWHLAGLVGLFLVVLTADHGKSDTGERRVNLRGMAVVWLFAAFVSALPSLQLYVHYYYLTLAPLAFLSAWAWRELAVRLSKGPWQQRFGALALAIIAAAFVGVQIQWDYADARGNDKRKDMSWPRWNISWPHTADPAIRLAYLGGELRWTSWPDSDGPAIRDTHTRSSTRACLAGCRDYASGGTKWSVRPRSGWCATTDRILCRATLPR